MQALRLERHHLGSLLSDSLDPRMGDWEMLLQ